MRPTPILRCALAVALAAMLAPAALAEAPPGAGERAALERAIAESRSSDPELRVRAIARLGDFPDPAAIAALREILVAEPPVPELRERSWLAAARALTKIAKAEPLPPEVLARLAVLGERKPEVLEERRQERSRYHAPKYDFADAARQAFATHRRAEIRRELVRELDGLEPARRVEKLSAIAWRSAGEDSAARSRQLAARELLLELGDAGAGAAAAAAVPSASEEVQGELLRFFEALCQRSPRADCLAGLGALAGSTHLLVWPHAFDRLGRLGTPEASAAVLERIRGLDARDPRRFRAGIAALGQLHQPSALPFLVDQLDHADAETGAAAARALVRFGADGKRALLEAGAGGSARARAAVFGGLRTPEYAKDAEVLFALRLLAPSDPRSNELLGSPTRIRQARVAALDELAAKADAAALFALARLAERGFSDPAEREEAWSQIARAVHALVDGKGGAGLLPELPAELVGFLRAIATSAPQAAYRLPKEHPPRERSYAYREWAQSALLEIDLAAAREALGAELEALPAERRPDRVAELAWAGERCRELRCQAARSLLAGFGSHGLDQTRPWLRRAPAESRYDMVGFLRSAYAQYRDGAAADLLVLADADEPRVWEEAHAALRELRPQGVAASLVHQLEQHAEPARTRAGLETLGALGDPSAAPFAQHQLSSADEATSLAAARALARLGEHGRRWLVGSLPRLPETAQRAAALALADVDEAAAHEALVQLAATTRDVELRRWLLARLRSDGDVERRARGTY